MFRFFIFFIFASFSLFSLKAYSEPKQISLEFAATMVKKVDSYLNKYTTYKSDISVQQFKADKLYKVKKYRVFAQKNRQSLVVFKTGNEQGQKVLMKGHNFWVFLPESKRPLRISPRQKLFGDASVGDIVNLRFGADYQVQTASCGAQECRLYLQKNYKGATYEFIELFIAAKTYKPLRANLLLKSKKLAKVASYTLEAKALKQIHINNKITKDEKTIMNIDSLKEFFAPLKWFNPAFIAKNQNLTFD